MTHLKIIKGLLNWLTKPVGVLFCGLSREQKLPESQRKLKTPKEIDPNHENAKSCLKLGHVRFLQGLSNALLTGQPITGHYTVFSYRQRP